MTDANRTRARIDGNGPLAILAAAYGMEFSVTPPQPFRLESEGKVAVVMIVGPLTHHTDWMGDTYDAIEERVREACQSTAAAVVLKIDSPGGDVDGCFECSRTLRAIAAQHGKRLIAYVDEQAASGGYALACAADEIYLPATGMVGSVGVIRMVADCTAANQAAGIQVRAFTSGSRKTDGNQNVPLTDEAAAEIQKQVEGLAAEFAGLVAESRKVQVEDVMRLQAAMFQGERAVGARLADGVKTWGEVLALVAGSPSENPAAMAGESDPNMSKGELVKALRAIAERDSEEGRQAKVLLAMMEKDSDGEEKPAEKSEGDEPDGDEKKPEGKAESDEQKPDHKEPDGDEAKAKAQAAKDPELAALAIAQAAKAETAALRAELKAKEDAATIKVMLDGRPDLDSNVRARLEKKSVEYVKEALEMIPKAPVNLAAAQNVQATRGAGQVGGGDIGYRADGLPVDQAQQMARAMGVVSTREEIRWERNDRVFPTAMSRDDAKKLLADNEKKIAAIAQRGIGGAQ